MRWGRGRLRSRRSGWRRRAWLDILHETRVNRGLVTAPFDVSSCLEPALSVAKDTCGAAWAGLAQRTASALVSGSSMCSSALVVAAVRDDGTGVSIGCYRHTDSEHEDSESAQHHEPRYRPRSTRRARELARGRARQNRMLECSGA